MSYIIYHCCILVGTNNAATRWWQSLRNSPLPFLLSPTPLTFVIYPQPQVSLVLYIYIHVIYPMIVQEVFSPAPLEMLRDLTGFDDPVELFDALDSNEKGEVGGIPAESGLGRLRIGKDKKNIQKTMGNTTVLDSILEFQVWFQYGFNLLFSFAAGSVNMCSHPHGHGVCKWEQDPTIVSLTSNERDAIIVIIKIIRRPMVSCPIFPWPCFRFSYGFPMVFLWFTLGLSHFPLRKIPFSQASRSSVPALGKSPCPIARWRSNACSASEGSDGDWSTSTGHD